MSHEEVILRVGNNRPLLRTSGQGLPGVGEIRAEFSDVDTSTGVLKPATIYSQVGTMTAPRVFVLSDSTKALATMLVPIAFLVIDESGTVTGTNKIILTPESGLIAGQPFLEITVGGGSWEIHTQGGNWFAR